MSRAFQSLLMNRRTATRLTAPASALTEEQEHNKTIALLDRAVACAQMAPNHKRTEPFSFVRFLAGSQAAATLADIAYQVSLRKTGSEPNAASKRRKWLQIPAFLVTLVHENQDSMKVLESSLGLDEYDLMTYLPPETERQLEDVSLCELE